MIDKADPGLPELWVPVASGTATLEPSYLIVPTPCGTWRATGIGAFSDSTELYSEERAHEGLSRKPRH